MHFDAIAPYLVETHLRIAEVLDGDSLIVENNFSQAKKEIRLYGVDAPEIKKNKKLREDEKKERLPAEFLILLGKKSTQFVLTIAPPGTSITLITEQRYYFDFYKRQLAYVILPNGDCLNEILIIEGYVKAMSEYYCSNLAKYQQLNLLAKQSGKGLYALTSNF